MKFLNLSLIATTLLGISAQDDCSANFTIAYEADPDGGQFCVKKTVGVENVSRGCLYKKGATTGCMRSAFAFAILQGTEENALAAAKECQCGEASPSSSSATQPLPSVVPPTLTSAPSSNALTEMTTTTHNPKPSANSDPAKCKVVTVKS